ncbi:MAG: sulfatase [Blastopirellula sp.]|nr:MAG: sulfatase [Blastopirellula sp.]
MRNYILSILTCLIFCSHSEATERPNIVLLLADDLGWTGVGCFGSDFYETPNIDRLASQGMKFTDSYAACTVCSPTRASIMTGIYPAKLHLTDFIAGQNRPNAKMRIPKWTKYLEHRYITIAESLQDAGYKTAHIGKWHLAQKGANVDDFGPTKHGFDVSYDAPAGTRGYQLKKGANAKGESKSDYLTDYLTDKAVEFIDQNHESPFFLFFAYHTPHTPIQGRKDLVQEFEKKVKPNAIHNNPEYAAMVHSLDQSIGRIVQRLEQHQLTENTVVMFSSDNGGLTQRYGKHDGFTENLPLRRGKGSAYEGGVRVPTIVRWPKVIQPGTVSKTPVSTIDYYPTFLEIAEHQIESSYAKTIDGVSLLPVLKSAEHQFDRELYWHYPHYHAGGDGPYTAVRSGNWRLIQFHDDMRTELYNLANDIEESKNQASDHPQLVTQLTDKLNKWRKSVNAQMPTENPDYDPALADQVQKSK